MGENQNERLSDSSKQERSSRAKTRTKIRNLYAKRLLTANTDYAIGTSHVYLDFDYLLGEHPDIVDEELWTQIWNLYQKKKK